MKFLGSLLLVMIGLTAIAQQHQQAFGVKVIGQGKPLLLIPGATCSGEVWEETVDRYKDRYTCHVLTLAGYAGLDTISGPPYLETYKHAIMTYIKENDLRELTLIGHSIGGFLSLWIASEIEEGYLKNVVVVDALPFLAAIYDPMAKAGFNEAAAQAMYQTYAQMNPVQLKQQQLAVASTMCSDTSKLDRIASWGSGSDPKTMAYTMTEMLGKDLRTEIAKIKVPVLVMGAFQEQAQFPQYTYEIAEASYKRQYEECKNAQLYIANGAKHFIMYDEPEWFFEKIDNFIH